MSKINNFADYMRTLEDGVLLSDLDDVVRDMVLAIEEAEATGQKPNGSITIKLALKKESGVIVTNPTLTVVKPKKNRRATLLWATPEGNLQRDNPKQMELGLREVTPGPGVRTLA